MNDTDSQDTLSFLVANMGGGNEDHMSHHDSTLAPPWSHAPLVDFDFDVDALGVYMENAFDNDVEDNSTLGPICPPPAANDQEAPEEHVQQDSSKLFPNKLYQVLSDNDPLYKACIDWIEDESSDWSFVIKDIAKFRETVLPECWGILYPSFTVQLGRYGFERERRPNQKSNTMYVRHPQFQRNRPDLCKMVTRVKV
jgi:hypothetical protein